MKNKRRIRGHKCSKCGSELNIIIGDMQSNGVTGSASCPKCRKVIWLTDYNILRKKKDEK